MKWTWKQAALYAGVIFAVWAILYGFYWHDRTGHAIDWRDAAVDWVGDIVMLQWVKSYQEMIAGFAALAAAAGVVWTAVNQRNYTVADRAAQEESELDASLIRLKAVALRLEFCTSLSEPTERIRLVTELLRNATDMLPRSAKKLSVILHICCSGIDSLLDLIERDRQSEGSIEATRFEIRRQSFMISAFMTGHERLVNGASYRHVKQVLDADQVLQARLLKITEGAPDLLVVELLEFPK